MWKLAAMAPLLLTLTACAGGGSAGEETTPAPLDNSSTESAPALEMAVSETCADDSNSQCVSINGESVLVIPSDFERVGVDTATSAGPSAIDVTLNRDGAEIVQRLTTEALQASENARLVTKLDTDLLSAVRVQGTLHSEHLQIHISPGVDADSVLEKLNNDAG